MVDMSSDTIQKRISTSTLPEESLDPVVTALLETYLREHNDLIRSFKFAAEVQEELEQRGVEEEDGRPIRIALVVNPRRKNIATMRSTDR